MTLQMYPAMWPTDQHNRQTIPPSMASAESNESERVDEGEQAATTTDGGEGGSAIT